MQYTECINYLFKLLINRAVPNSVFYYSVEYE